MSKLKYLAKILGLVGLVAGLLLFLTGCFDLDQEIWVTEDPENSYSRATITTDSEEIYELMQGSMTEDYEDEELEFRVIEPEDPDGDRKFEIIVESKLEEGTLEVFPGNGTVVYEVTLLGDEEESEDDEMIRALFEDHTFKFVINLPKPIREAWWGRYDTEDRELVGPEYVDGNTFSIVLELEQAMLPEYSHLTLVTNR